VTSVADERCDPARSTDELWLDALQRVIARATHEVKGALNGVAVNLEVVRSRCGNPNATMSGVVPFATNASGQLDVLTEMAEALLALARPAREPVEVTATLGHLAALLRPAARSEGFQIEIERPSGPGSVRARGNIVRLVLATALLGAFERESDVQCSATLEDEAIVRLTTADGCPIDMPAVIIDAAASAGIRIETDGHSISLAFPRAGRRAHEIV